MKKKHLTKIGIDPYYEENERILSVLKNNKIKPFKVKENFCKTLFKKLKIWVVGMEHV